MEAQFSEEAQFSMETKKLVFFAQNFNKKKIHFLQVIDL